MERRHKGVNQLGWKELNMKDRVEWKTCAMSDVFCKNVLVSQLDILPLAHPPSVEAVRQTCATFPSVVPPPLPCLPASGASPAKRPNPVQKGNCRNQTVTTTTHGLVHNNLAIF